MKGMAMPRITGIDPQAIKIATATRPDLQQYVLGCIHLAPGSSNGRARVWVMAFPAAIVRELSFTNATQKDDSIALEILSDGSVQITTSEAGSDNSGASSQPVVVHIPAVFPPAPAGGGGGGGSTTNVDQTARNMAAAAQSTADQALATANSAKTTANDAKNTATNALNTAQSAHARLDSMPVWWGADLDYQKSKDSVYGELLDPHSGIYTKIVEIATAVYQSQTPPARRPASSSGDPDDPDGR